MGWYEDNTYSDYSSDNQDMAPSDWLSQDYSMTPQETQAANATPDYNWNPNTVSMPMQQAPWDSWSAQDQAPAPNDWMGQYTGGYGMDASNLNNGPAPGTGYGGFQGNPNTQGSSFGDMWDKGTGALAKLFGNGAGAGGVAASTPYLKSLLGLLGANQEKRSNQQMASQIPQQVNQMRAQTSPFDNPADVNPNSMRGQTQAQALAAQARLNAFRDNPNSDEGYKNLSTFDAQRVARLAAANKPLTDPITGDVIGGGSRMNPGATSIASKSYDTMRQLAIQKQMQADRDALMQQSGSGQYMGMGGLEQLLSGIKYGAQGNSPYFSAAGYATNANQYANNPDLQSMMAEWKAQQGNR
jgi:hypothetical protein